MLAPQRGDIVIDFDLLRQNHLHDIRKNPGDSPDVQLTKNPPKGTPCQGLLLNESRCQRACSAWAVQRRLAGCKIVHLGKSMHRAGQLQRLIQHGSKQVLLQA